MALIWKIAQYWSITILIYHTYEHWLTLGSIRPPRSRNYIRICIRIRFQHFWASIRQLWLVKKLYFHPSYDAWWMFLFQALHSGRYILELTTLAPNTPLYPNFTLLKYTPIFPKAHLVLTILEVSGRPQLISVSKKRIRFENTPRHCIIVLLYYLYYSLL